MTTTKSEMLSQLKEEVLKNNENQLAIRKEIKQIIEALLFSSSEPLSLKKIRNIVSNAYPCDNTILTTLINELKQQYVEQESAFSLEEIAKGFLLRTKPKFNPFIASLLQKQRPERLLSQAALEVLSIIAYKQPVTRTQIDQIRGVDSSGGLYSLLEKELIMVVGKLDVIGRPSLYGTSELFLKHFGLKHLKDLPPLEAEELATSHANLL